MSLKPTGLAILGSTGSIGGQTLDIVRKFRDKFRITGLSCNESTDTFREQLSEFRPRWASINSRLELPVSTSHATSEEIAADPEADIIVIAMTGSAGLMPAIAALKAGKTVAIANKEILVMAGALLTKLRDDHGATILPIDSEHCAIWQCLRGEDSPISRLLLTASGGPFYQVPRERLWNVTAAEALKHPTWQMGKKVTIDSATLFNKGLEVLEAHWLFETPMDKIDIVIHRQSIIHSMVEFQDGSIKAQLSCPDMRLPIQYALFHPQRLPNDVIKRLDFKTTVSLTLEPVIYGDFPCLELALQAGRMGNTYPAALCAADEVAVSLFLDNKIAFTEIATIIERVLDMHKPVINPSLEDIVLCDSMARETALKAARKEI